MKSDWAEKLSTNDYISETLKVVGVPHCGSVLESGQNMPPGPLSMNQKRSVQAGTVKFGNVFFQRFWQQGFQDAAARWR